MSVAELRDLDDARRYVLQGLWPQRVCKPAGVRLKPVLEWCLEILSNGHPLPPAGVVADLGHYAFGFDPAAAAREAPHLPGWPATLARSYEDYVLGKVYADWTFERAADALRRYPPKDRPRGLDYLVAQLRDQLGVSGVELSPAVVRGMLAANPDDLLAQGFESFTRDGPHPLLVKQYEELVSAARRSAEVLHPEDVIALEQRTALADMGQYVAHRQILRETAKLEAALPSRPVRPLVGRREVPTRVHDEDQYPVGGYTSISNRGSIESLLHSQLAYMEPVESPDLFDVKFVRDELFYYSRDENQFLRRRRAFVFVFAAELANARFKDADLPAQRIVMAASAALALVRRLADWLSTDALRFELLFVNAGDTSPLADERTLFELLLSELRERGAAAVTAVPTLADAAARCVTLARTAQTQVLVLGTDAAFEPEGALVTWLELPGSRPALLDPHGDTHVWTADDPPEAWAEAVLRVLQMWV